MQTQNAINRLVKNGWTVGEFDLEAVSEVIFASKDDAQISFVSQSGKVRSNGFTYNDANMCAPTYGLSLRGAME